VPRAGRRALVEQTRDHGGDQATGDGGENHVIAAADAIETAASKAARPAVMIFLTAVTLWGRR
jgi:hypothetical protein